MDEGFLALHSLFCKKSLLVSIFLLVNPIYGSAAALPREVKQVGKLEVGSKLPDYTGISQRGKYFGAADPEGRFYVHVIDDQLPPTCFDLECSDAMRCVVDRGAHVMGSSDGKIAKLFGIQILAGRPWKLSERAVTLSTPDRTIVKIYKDASLQEVCDIVNAAAMQGSIPHK